MSSDAQIAANLANAQASTGPRTEHGKQASSRNALKHGLTASTILIPGEDPAEYDRFRLELTEYWDPQGAGEVAFVEELISAQWRLNRCGRLEAAILSAEAPDFKALNNVSLHAARLKRQFSATLKELTVLQTARAEQRAQDVADATAIRRTDLASNRQTDLADFGFDFTVDAVDRHIRFQDRLAQAADATPQAGKDPLGQHHPQAA